MYPYVSPRRMRQTIAWYLLLSFFTMPLYALDPNRRVTQYMHTIWTTDQGLPQNNITSILQTRNGYIWCGTLDGLVRFDGVRFGYSAHADSMFENFRQSRGEGFGPEVKRRIMLGTYALSAGYYDAFYGKALKVRTLIRRDFDAAYERFDVLLSPTSPTTAFPFGDKTADPMAMYLNDVCTIPTNLAGHPAMSVPFGVGDDGLPVGVQVLAPALGEVVMFRTAAVLEGSVR